MLLQDALEWLDASFKHPVPDDYLEFLMKGDFETTRMGYYVADRKAENVFEVSEWFTYENLADVYACCLEEGIIEGFHLPIFDSMNCTVVIDCDIDGETYGHIFSRPPTGRFDEGAGKNVYDAFVPVADSFSRVIGNLLTLQKLEELEARLAGEKGAAR